jgi:iron complex outermembrane recepter protein
MRQFLLATSAIVALGITSPAFAQAGTGTAAEDENGIAEIVVTAQKKEQSLQDAAIAMAAMIETYGAHAPNC